MCGCVGVWLCVCECVYVFTNRAATAINRTGGAIFKLV